jgi:hypothetical protein
MSDDALISSATELLTVRDSFRGEKAHQGPPHDGELRKLPELLPLVAVV